MDFKHVKKNEEKICFREKGKSRSGFLETEISSAGIVGLINDPNGFSQF